MTKRVAMTKQDMKVLKRLEKTDRQVKKWASCIKKCPYVSSAKHRKCLKRCWKRYM